MPLHGREVHLERLETALRTAAESRRSTVVLLESAAGTGKTRLLLEAAAVAEPLGFAVVEGVVDEHGQVNMPTPVAPAAARPNRTSAPNPDRLAWLTGQIEARLQGRLRRGPVLAVLDDAQCADPLVVRALNSLALKLIDVPVVWLFALRSEDADSPNNLLLRRLVRSHPAASLCTLEHLDDDAVAALMGDLLGAEPDDDVRALGESLGGMPQVAVDLVRGLLEEDCLSIADGTASLADGSLTSGIASAVAPEPDAHLPGPFVRLIHERLEQLAPATQRSLQVAAVLGVSFCPRDLMEMLDESPVALLAPLREALTAGLVTYGPERFSFRHELVWRAVVGTVPPLMRSLLHRQAADMILAREGGSADAAAIHLVHCAQAGDAQAIDPICTAAENLLPTSPRDAAALALRGLELARRGQPEHIRLAITATIGLLRHGNLQQAIEVAESLVTLSRSDGSDWSVQTLRAWLATALQLRGDARTAFEILREAPRLGTSAPRGGETCSTLLRLDVLSPVGESGATAMAAEQVITVKGTHSTDVHAAALNIRALARWREGRIDDALDALDQAAALPAPLTSLWQAGPLWTKACMLTQIRKLDEAMSTVETIQHTIISEHNRVLAAVPLALRAWVHIARGDLAAAEADAEAGIRVSKEVQMPLWEPKLHAALVVAALRRGELTAADERLALLGTDSGEYEQRWSVTRCLVTAQVTAARHGARAALGALGEFVHDPGKLRQLLLEDPSATAWCVRTALAADDRETASLIVGTATEISVAACAYPTVAAAATHGRALLIGDPESLTGVAEDYADPWAAASVTEDLGVLLGSAEREQAIAALNIAMASYHGLGAVWDEARVRKRLRRLGVRRRHWKHVPRPQTGWDSLTRAEEGVAQLVARGLTNRQVAGELFVSPHTVGFHLRQIYRKLAIQSRVDLARIACTR
ncbi:helix-turn-helix transcriptional regulator [Streptomyces adelaidensis]|uniref:helix-turn-helix transcriptional regulator n=1 Tax=Streptomyces adelaidensis TaxID=2796465 RepID=UPI0019053614|nr:LuxR family transcriptional regulator [Streptomyces adelaidensis]